jgi:hypothetical protein
MTRRSSTSRSEWLSRYRRTENPPRMQLTERDIMIIRLVWDCRYLTRLQIQRFLFPSQEKGKEHSRKNIVTKRLMLLYHNGYLDRLHPPVASSRGSSAIVYCLDRKGARLLAAELAVDMPAVGWQKRQRDRGLLFLQHTLAVNDFQIAVTLAARQDGYEILRWLDERSLRKDEAKEELKEIALEVGKQGSILPDAYFTLKVDGKKAGFFVEVDRGTTPGRRIRCKVRMYRAYYASGLYEQHFGSKSLRVLTVTTSDGRLANLKRWSEAERGDRLFWFTTDRSVEPGAVLVEPIWKVAGEEGLHALV